MLRTRVIPILLLKNSGLYKGEKFKKHKYVGDPINAVKIFNEKEVDELTFLDISATNEKRGPNFDVIADIASEAFMPFGYGGGISKVWQVERLFSLGVEKVIINSEAFYNKNLVTEAASVSGSQSIVVALDVKSNLFGKYEVYVNNGTVRTKMSPVEYAKRAEEAGAGELCLTSIDKEGTGSGYDEKLIEAVSSSVDIPVIANGGAGCLEDFANVVKNTHVSAVAAGDMFVFHGKHKAVLITYPQYSELEELLKEN